MLHRAAPTPSRSSSSAICAAMELDPEIAYTGSVRPGDAERWSVDTARCARSATSPACPSSKDSGQRGIGTVPSAAESPMRVAFHDIVNPGWTAGAHYYRNLFIALRQLDDGSRPRIVVLVPPTKRTGGYHTYRDLADEVVELPDAGVVDRYVRRATRRLGMKPRSSRQFDRMLANERHRRHVRVLGGVRHARRRSAPGLDTRLPAQTSPRALPVQGERAAGRPVRASVGE